MSDNLARRMLDEIMGDCRHSVRGRDIDDRERASQSARGGADALVEWIEASDAPVFERDTDEGRCRIGRARARCEAWLEGR